MFRRLLAFAAFGGLLCLGAAQARADFDLLVADNGDNTILRVTPTGTVTTFASTNLDSPIGLAVNAATGDVYVANNGVGAGTENTVSEFSSTGSFIRSFGSAQLNAPQGLAIDAATGNVYVANADGHIQEYSSTGSFIQTFKSGLSDPYAVLINNGSLYATEFGNNTIVKFTLSTGTQTASNTAALDGPDGLTIGSNGDLFVSNFSKATRNPLDTVTEYNATTLSLVGTFATSDSSGLSGPIGLAVGNTTHDFYVANNFAGTIERFDSSGNDLGTLADGINGPTFIAFLPTAVPEPASVALMGLGIAGMLTYTRRRARSHEASRA